MGALKMIDDWMGSSSLGGDGKSFGVLYELLTREWPFASRPAISAAVVRGAAGGDAADAISRLGGAISASGGASSAAAV